MGSDARQQGSWLAIIGGLMVVAQIGFVFASEYLKVIIYKGEIGFSDGYFVLVLGGWILLPSFLIFLGGYMGRRNRRWGLLSVIASLPLLGKGLSPLAGAALGFAGGIIMQGDWIQHGSWLAIIGGLMTVAHDGLLYINSEGWKHLSSFVNLIFWGLLLCAVPIVLGGYIGRRDRGLGGQISTTASLPLLIISTLSLIPIGPLHALWYIFPFPPDAGAVLGIAGGLILLKQRSSARREILADTGIGPEEGERN